MCIETVLAQCHLGAVVGLVPISLNMTWRRESFRLTKKVGKISPTLGVMAKD